MHPRMYKAATAGVAAVLGGVTVFAVTVIASRPGGTPPASPPAAAGSLPSLPARHGTAPSARATASPSSVPGSQPRTGQPVLAAKVQQETAADTRAPQPSPAPQTTPASRPGPSESPASSRPPSVATSPPPRCLIGVSLPAADVCANLTIGG